MTMEKNENILLKVNNLVVTLNDQKVSRTLVDGVSLEIGTGEKVAVVGESGSGKTLTALAIMGLLSESHGWLINGEIEFQGQSLVRLNDREKRKLRGRSIAMIFQEPASALNPVMTCGYQVQEMLTVHFGWSKQRAKEATLQLLSKMRFPDPAAIARAYPHELSGGMRQRVALAMVIAVRPKLIIADEPVSLLDIENRYFIFHFLMNDPVMEQSGLLLITHQLGNIEKVDRILVMYASRPVEYAPTELLFRAPNHPYTKQLLSLIEQTVKPRLTEIPGQMIPPDRYFNGCHFAERCERVMPVCRAIKPIWRRITEDHYSACWLNENNYNKN